jgi:hypothetical protein
MCVREGERAHARATDREGERERARATERVCVSVCVIEREGDRQKETEKERATDRDNLRQGP